MRSAYSCLFVLAIPLILLRLLWRSIKAPAYRSRWNERFACYSRTVSPVDIWCHAVSVGEAEALFPLIRQIQQKQSGCRILVTTTTPTGSARVQAVLQKTVEHVYLPYDTPYSVKRFFCAFKPRIAVIMETEIWPNLFSYCGLFGIPLYVVNARLSEKSMRGYQKIPAIIRPALSQIALISAQTQADADRFVAIGASPLTVQTLGNIKFDVEIPQSIIDQSKQIKQQLFSGRFVWLAASTHQGEEAALLKVYQQLKPQLPDLLLVIVPRHPERFGEVAKLCQQNKLNIITRTSKQATAANTDILLVDTMGELKMFYAAADAAFVGGSLVPTGGHNVLEAAAVGAPVLFGPFMHNFKDIADRIVEQKAAILCQNEAALAEALLDLYEKPAYRQELVAKGKQFIEQNQGTLNRIYAILETAITKLPGQENWPN